MQYKEQENLNETISNGENTGAPGGRSARVLLAVTPFWDPLIPPQGIASIKAFLQKKGFQVKTVDTNIESQFMNRYNEYFDYIKSIVPEEKHGNFFSIGHFVLQNQMSAHFNHTDETRYLELVKILVYKTFYTDIDDSQAFKLMAIIQDLYERLEIYFRDLLSEYKPDVLGLTVNTGTFPASLFVFETAKKYFPHIKTIMGGNIFADQMAPGSPNFEFLLEKTRSTIDKIMIGQGELLLYKYLTGGFPEEQRVYTRQDLKGEALTFADLELPDLSDYNVPAYAYLGATGSASCQYQCSFCNSVKFYGEFRVKDIHQTVSEITRLHKEHENQLFFMTDSMLNPIVDTLSAQVVEKELPIYYDAYFRIDEASADIDRTLAWRRGGFYRSRIGVESGSQRMLELIEKQVDVEQIKAAVHGLAYAGIKTTTYWVVGLPGETEEDFLQTLALLEDLRNDIWQAEVAQFDYYYAGQSKSEEWADKRMLLYPPWAKDMVISQSWILNCPPSREETYQRIFRFANHCKKLGIPNPYSLPEINDADERWRRLHPNAVPAVLEFKKHKIPFSERDKVKKRLTVKTTTAEQDNFGF